MRKLLPLAGVALTVLLGALLLVTIYFTLFDLQWIVFLSGVLLAATAATASQASKAQWMIARRTRQLQRTKQALADEAARRERASQAQMQAEARLQLINDALPVMIAYVDRDERCHQHNRAFAQWGRHSGDEIEGRLLRDVIGAGVYGQLKPRIAEALAGRKTQGETGWRRLDGETADCTVTLLPFPPETERPPGFYLLVAAHAEAWSAPPAAAVESVGDVLVVPNASGESVYLESMTEQLISGADPRGQLVRALQEDHFILFTQKIRPLAPAAGDGDGDIAEVLLRLQEEEKNMLPPGGFFPIAERYNLMEEIDRWVVRNLLKWCAKKRRDNRAWRTPLYCVNLCGATLCDAGFAPYVEGELDRYAMPAESLCFEIAEPDLLDHYRAVHSLMHALKPRGCRFTADAFGSVKVSFASFRELKFDFIKIDGSIIQNIVRERSDLAKTRAIAAACRNLGVRTIAEFVESDETLALLRDIGIDYAQGFGIGKPGPIGHSA